VQCLGGSGTTKPFALVGLVLPDKAGTGSHRNAKNTAEKGRASPEHTKLYATSRPPITLLKVDFPHSYRILLDACRVWETVEHFSHSTIFSTTIANNTIPIPAGYFHVKQFPWSCSSDSEGTYAGFDATRDAFPRKEERSTGEDKPCLNFRRFLHCCRKSKAIPTSASRRVRIAGNTAAVDSLDPGTGSY
jgi:hypothetical protein